MDASSRKQGAKRRNVPAHVTDWNDTVDEEMALFCLVYIFCRRMDASSRKQGAKRRSVPAHVTELSNAVDEESAPKGEQKKAKGAEPLWNPAILGVFLRLAGYWLLNF